LSRDKQEWEPRIDESSRQYAVSSEHGAKGIALRAFSHQLSAKKC